MRDAEQADHNTTLRIDKWLWFARFFKTRSLATNAVNGGLVHVNGTRVKASRALQVGDQVNITRDEVRMEIVVRGIPVRRGPAPEARSYYLETDASIAANNMRKQHAAVAPAPKHRPEKHDRRALRMVKGRDGVR